MGRVLLVTGLGVWVWLVLGRIVVVVERVRSHIELGGGEWERAGLVDRVIGVGEMGNGRVVLVGMHEGRKRKDGPG